MNVIISIERDNRRRANKALCVASSDVSERTVGYREKFSSSRSIMKQILGHGSRGLRNTDEEKVKSVHVTDVNAM